MPIIPTPGSNQPPVAPAVPIDQQTVAPAADATPNFDGQAYAGGQQTGHVEFSEEQLRAAAGELGLNFDVMNAEEHEFVAMFARGALGSTPPAVEGDINNDPIVLPDGTTVDPTTAPATEPAATQEPGAEGAGVGSAPIEPEGGGVPVTPVPPVTSPEQAVAGGAPGAPVFEIPSPLPPASPAPAQQQAPVQQAPETMVQLQNGQMVPLWYAQQLAAQQQAPVAPPALPQQIPGQPFIPPTTPPAGYTTPFGTEYVDERAGAEIQQLRGEFQQTISMMQQQQQMEQQRQQALHAQAIDQAIIETTSGYGNARGLTPQESEALLSTATQMGALGMYSQMYPGDPRRAVGAALEMTYWITPEMRQREVDRTIEQQRSEIAETERKKATAGATVSSSGSVPRTAPARPANRAEADKGIVAMIEADLASQNGGVTRR